MAEFDTFSNHKCLHQKLLAFEVPGFELSYAIKCETCAQKIINKIVTYYKKVTSHFVMTWSSFKPLYNKK